MDTSRPSVERRRVYRLESAAEGVVIDVHRHRLLPPVTVEPDRIVEPVRAARGGDDEAVIDDGEVCGEQEGEPVPHVAAQEGMVSRVEFRPLDGSPVVPALLDIALLDRDAGGPDAAAGVVLGNHDRPGRIEAGA